MLFLPKSDYPFLYEEQQGHLITSCREDTDSREKGSPLNMSCAWKIRKEAIPRCSVEEDRAIKRKNEGRKLG